MSVVAEVAGALERLEALRADIGAVAALDPERSLREAEESDRRLGDGTARPLEGVITTVKNWIDVEGWPVTGESADHRGRVAEADATAVARLRQAGAVVVCISRALADDPVYGPTRNPLDPSRAPGGSSSGTAALVAAGAVSLGLGSDSGGSIRLPAAWCGVAGLKPTFGRVPLTGHFPECGFMEDGRTVIGPIARTVAELAAALAVIAGPDGRDAGMPPVPLQDPATVDFARLRVGWCGSSPAVDFSIAQLARAGAEIADRPLPDLREAALAITRRYWRREALSGAENVKLLADWDAIRRQVAILVEDVDVVVTPATDGPAPTWRESEEADYGWLLLWSLTGSPAVVVRAAEEDGLPLAAQVIARPWQDHVALAAAGAVELGFDGR